MQKRPLLELKVDREDFVSCLVDFPGAAMRCLASFSARMPIPEDFTENQTAPISLCFDRRPCLSISIGESEDSFRDLVANVTIPKTVERLEPYAFSMCKNLRRVWFPEGGRLKVIGHDAFRSDAWNPSVMQVMEIPETVEEIGEQCFVYCQNLIHLTFRPNSRIRKLGNRFVYGQCYFVNGIYRPVVPLFEHLAVPDSVEEFSERAFFNFYIPLTLAFSENTKLRRLGDGAFSCFKNYASLWTVLCVPDTVEEIGNECFHNSTIQSVIFSSSSRLKTLGFQAFAMSKIRMFVCPDTVEVIPCMCFRDCDQLQACAFGPNSELRVIQREAFTCSKLASIVLPRKLELICENAFGSCFNLTDVVFLGNELKTIEARAFHSTKIGRVKIPSSVEEIGPYGFETYWIREVEFAPDTRLRALSERAFANSQISEIKLPATLEVLGANCFCQCRDLSVVEFMDPSRLREIGKGVFRHTKVDIEALKLSPEQKNALKAREKKQKRGCCCC